MSKKIITLCMTFALFLLGSINTSQAQTRTTLPNDFGIELAGKAVIYSFSYQWMAVPPLLGLQASLGVLGTSEDVVVFIPLGGKLYVIPNDASPFVTGGIVILTGTSGSGPLKNSTTYGYTGLGFEYRSEGGLLFRATAYGLFAEGEFLIWPGLYIGYAF